MKRMPKLTGFFKPLSGDGAEPTSISPSQTVSITNTRAMILPEPGPAADLALIETEAMEVQSSSDKF